MRIVGTTHSFYCLSHDKVSKLKHKQPKNECTKCANLSVMTSSCECVIKQLVQTRQIDGQTDTYTHTLLLFSHSVLSDSAIPWSVAHQASLSRRFPRQEYWNGLLFLSPRDLPNPGIEPTSPVLAGRFSTAEPPGKPTYIHNIIQT